MPTGRLSTVYAPAGQVGQFACLYQPELATAAPRPGGPRRLVHVRRVPSLIWLGAALSCRIQPCGSPRELHAKTYIYSAQLSLAQVLPLSTTTHCELPVLPEVTFARQVAVMPDRSA